MRALSPQAINTALLIGRVCLGLTIAAHGYGKFFRGGKIAGTAGWFNSMGMKPGKFHAILAATTEVGSGLLMAAGLLTSFAGAGIVALMLVAGYTVHRNNGFFIVKSGWEYNFILAVMAVCIAMLGPGKWSLDHQFGLIKHLAGWTGLAISAGIGLVGGIGQLVIFYRPPAED